MIVDKIKKREFKNMEWGLLIVAIILLYCKFVKGNDMIKGLIKEKVIKNKKKNT